jgi:hypothetical protein
MIKSGNMRWMGQVARMGEMRNTYTMLAEKTSREETSWEILAKTGGYY